MAPAKGQFVRHNVIDLVVAIVPLFRPLRVVRSARALRLLRAARGGAFLLRGMDAVQDVLKGYELYSGLYRLEHVSGTWLADQLSRLEGCFPEVHVVIADSRRFAQEWSHRFPFLRAC